MHRIVDQTKSRSHQRLQCLRQCDRAKMSVHGRQRQRQQVCGFWFYYRCGGQAVTAALEQVLHGLAYRHDARRKRNRDGRREQIRLGDRWHGRQRRVSTDLYLRCIRAGTDGHAERRHTHDGEYR